MLEDSHRTLRSVELHEYLKMPWKIRDIRGTSGQAKPYLLGVQYHVQH